MCLENCLKGRNGKCCFGCSTRLGIHLIALFTLAEVFIIGWIFFGEVGDGIFNLKVFTWLMIVVSRTFTYLATCCDSISKRWAFFVMMILTTIVELVLFTLMNIWIFSGTIEDSLFSVLAAWGWSSWVQIFATEVVTGVHLCLFIYFCAVVFEYYTFARDDPKMIDAEHAFQASAEKKAAAERKRSGKKKQGDNEIDIE